MLPRLRQTEPLGEGQWQGQGHRLRHGHELRADGRAAHQGAAHRLGFGCGQLRAGLRVRRRRPPHRPSQIGHERYTYDANGNTTLVENDSLNTERRMAWNEENRLTALSDNGK